MQFMAIALRIVPKGGYDPYQVDLGASVLSIIY